MKLVMKNGVWMASCLMVISLSACSGTDGERGADGVSTLVTAFDEPAGENCPEGGQQIVFGGDDDGDGVLSDDEIDGSTIVCDGEAGETGEPGEAGEPGETGEPGEDGEDGAASLIDVTDESAGANCANGGLRVDYGVDTNRDGVLDGDEVDGTDYVCDGEDAVQILVEVTDEPSGTNCDNGGQKIVVGRDFDGDGTLGTGETEQTSYACNGVDGSDGTDGSDGSDGADGLNSLVTVSDEPVGGNCEFGGKKIEVGLDDDADGVLAASEVDQTSYICESGNRVELLTPPDVATVFNSPSECYFYQNNLANGIWHQRSNRIIVGDFSDNGYWSHSAGAGGYSPTPDNDTANKYHTIVHSPATSTVIRTGTSTSSARLYPIDVGSISPIGELSGFSSAVFSDGFSGRCNLISATPTDFLCYDGSGIRHYETTSGSANLNWTKTVTLSVQPAQTCPDGIECYARTFAWDGENYYFANGGGSSNSRSYRVYDANGTSLGLYTANGSGNINATYFDWSIGRYATHDGFGNRSGTNNYTWSGGYQGDDSQCYGDASPYHVGSN